MKKPDTAIDPLDHQDAPLWCVYGTEFWPQILCAKIKNGNMWGYSVWKGEPGFRTLGIKVAEFIGREEMCFFFAEQGHALDFLKVITTPKVSK